MRGYAIYALPRSVQGRFKSIVLEDADRLSWLCHYMHLNPVRAGICAVSALGKFRHSSYWWLLEGKRGRPDCLSFGVMLDACGGLRDGPAGRRKYCDYLKWLAADEPRQKAYLFDRMSGGWALGTKEFKTALLEDAKNEVVRSVLEGEADGEAGRLLWESCLEKCLSAIGKSREDCREDRRSAPWKVAICSYMRRAFGCQVVWLSERLDMGAAAGVSRCMKRLRSGELKEAEKWEERLRSRIKN